jgi:hypothetical protein
MRPRTMLSLLLPAALACSGREPSPTEVRPEFVIACPRATITASPTSVTKSPNTTGSTKFIVTNNCTTNLIGLASVSSRTGAVTSVGSPSPSTLGTLAPGASASVLVSFNVGSSGTGTVVLTGTPDLGTASTGTQAVTVSGGTGVPFGPADLFLNSTTLRKLVPFTWTADFTDSASIVTQINTARSNHIKFALVMTGGGHAQYLDSTTSPPKFSFAKWKAKQNKFDTPAIRSAVASGVADGTIPFAVLMDEPNHSSWGGVMNHAKLDSMSRYTKAIFTTLRTGVNVTYDWDTTSTMYQSVDVMTTQYSARRGDVNTYRTAAVSSAAKQKVALFFSINILDGGTDLRSTGCPMPQTGGPGTTENGVLSGCKMTAAQVQSFGDGLLVAPEACGLQMWTWDLTTLTATGDFMTRADNLAAFNHVAGTAGAHAARPCVKPL